MKRFTTWVLTGASVLALLAVAADPARAQLAGGKGPIDVTADQLEMVDAQHLAIWRGNVEALQDGDRLVADVLNVYFSGKANPGAPGAPAPPPTPAGPPGAGSIGSDWGDVQRLVADGHVFYVTKDQTARGDHAVYEAAPDTIVMTGDVVLVQGQNVVKGDRLTIDVKTNHAQVFSNVQGRNHPERVRGVFYNANNAANGAPAAPANGAAPAATPPAKP
ncbi:MAG TPA: LptA/OstA family protein [Caulobacteraceae bacterium]|nr:LptA/OstA family protein [Caulobacteraceae bacterium]